MHQFRYLHGISIAPAVTAPPTVCRRDVDEIFLECHDHLVLVDVRSVSTHQPCPLHPYTTPDAEGDPFRPAHQKILKEKQARDEYVVDLSEYCG